MPRHKSGEVGARHYGEEPNSEKQTRRFVPNPAIQPAAAISRKQTLLAAIGHSHKDGSWSLPGRLDELGQFAHQLRFRERLLQPGLVTVDRGIRQLHITCGEEHLGQSAGRERPGAFSGSRGRSGRPEAHASRYTLIDDALLELSGGDQ
ncbi:hypothetical protein [Methylobacterium sp. CM6257]